MMRPSLRSLCKALAKVREPGGGRLVAQAAGAFGMDMVLLVLVWAVVLCLSPLYGACLALRPATRAVGATKAWRRWLDWRLELVNGLTARNRGLSRQASAREWRMGRLWSQKRMAILRRGGVEASRSRLRSLTAEWLAAIAMAIILVAAVALASPCIMVLMVTLGLKEMGLKRADDCLENFVYLPLLGVELIIRIMALRGPFGWIWLRLGAVSRTARIVAQRLPSESPRRAGGLWGVNEFVLSCRSRHESVGCRKDVSAGRVNGYELWLDPKLARQSMDPAGWLGVLLGGFEDGPRIAWETPLACLVATAEYQHWSLNDNRLVWLRWVEAMGEQGDLDKDFPKCVDAGRGSVARRRL